MSTRERLTRVMGELAAQASEESRAGMARYGINVTDAFGILGAAEALTAADRRDPAARSARWVARDALRELRSDKVLRRF